MLPEPLFWIAGRPITLYHVLYAVGFLPALALALRLAWERRYPLNTILNYWLIAVIAALGGGKLIADFAQRFIAGIPDTWSFGQFLAVTVVFAVYRLFIPPERRLPHDSVDLAASSVILYLGIARFGCFSAGCCHGRPAWDLPWAVTFTNPKADTLFQGIPIHPTQLYEAAGAFAILGLLLALRNRPAWRGRLAWLFLLCYGLLRFTVEFYRGDVRTMIGPVSMNQIIALVMALAGGITLVVTTRRRQTVDRVGVAQSPIVEA